MSVKVNIRKAGNNARANSRTINRIIKKTGHFGLDNESKSRYRKAYSSSENRAFQFLRNEMKQLGLDTKFDKSGNLYGTLEGTNKTMLMAGSHLDGVNNGGLYDGVAGVACSLEAVKLISRIGYNPRNNLVVVAWRAEESVRFGIPYIGSRAAFGCLENEDLMLKKGNDLRLINAMEKSGHSYEGRPYIGPEMIKAYIELHAEQGRTLYELGKPIGIVTSISGNLRFYLRFIGNPDHTGGCKHEYRRNASLVAAELELAVAELPWQFRNRSDFHLTSTLIRPGSNLNFTTVPADVLTYIEIRCNRNTELNEAYDMILAKAEEIAERRSVVLKKVKEPKKSQVIEKLDPYILEIMADSAIALGESPVELPSGAGHDAVTLSKLDIPSAMLFVPSVEGYAHHPDEFTHPNDLKKGAEVLAETIIRIDKEKN